MDDKDLNDEKEFNYMKETIVDKARLRKRRIRNISFLVFLFILVFVIIFISIKQPEPNDPIINSNETNADVNETDPVEIIVEDDAYKSQMNIEDYKAIYSNLKEAGESTGKYIVTVSAISDNEDGLSSYMDNEGITSGLITSINNNVCIMTDYATVASADKIRVKFLNGESEEAKLLKADNSSGIAILSVAVDKITSNTRKSIGVAPFGDLSQIEIGDPIIIVGNPYGDNHYMTFGALTSTTGYIGATDDVYRLLVTDVVVSGKENGFIINLDGKIIGFISTLNKNDSLNNVLSGVAISDITDIINKLSEGKNIPYLGINGQEITDEVIDLVQEDMPYGVYVKDVEVGSPAYSQGIVSGDIIVNLAGEQVRTLNDYKEILINKSVGEEITITVNRKGRNGYYEYNYNVVLGSR